MHVHTPSQYRFKTVASTVRLAYVTRIRTIFKNVKALYIAIFWDSVNKKCVYGNLNRRLYNVSHIHLRAFLFFGVGNFTKAVRPRVR
jgi:hypothetical protein